MIKPLTCPVCGQPVTASAEEASRLLPFCSERCRSIDLFRWSEGKYAIVEDLAERPDIVAELLEQMEADGEEFFPDDEQDA